MCTAWMAALKPGKSYKAYRAVVSLLPGALCSLYSALCIRHDNVRGGCGERERSCFFATVYHNFFSQPPVIEISQQSTHITVMKLL